MPFQQPRLGVRGFRAWGFGVEGVAGLDFRRLGTWGAQTSLTRAPELGLATLGLEECQRQVEGALGNFTGEFPVDTSHCNPCLSKLGGNFGFRDLGFSLSVWGKGTFKGNTGGTGEM